MSALAQAAAATGERDRARRLLAEAEDLARAITDPYRQAEAVSALAQARGRDRRARPGSAAARRGRGPGPRHHRPVLARGGGERAGPSRGRDRTGRQFDRAEDLARAITDPYEQAEAVSALAQAAAATGEFDRAEDLARAITNQATRRRR